MITKKITPLALGIFALCACAPSTTTNTSSSTEEEDEFNWVSPVGIPAIAFFNQGENENWTSTNTPASIIPSAFANGTFDAIVFDGINGLNQVTKKNAPYKMARWISGGTYYLVSVKHDSAEDLTSASTIDSFVQGGIADQAFLSLSEDAWGIADYTGIAYEEGVAATASKLTSNPESFDFFLISQPQLTQATATLAQEGKTVNIIYNLQTEWKAEYGADAEIPAAGLFISNKAIEEKKGKVDEFLDMIEKSIQTAVGNPSEVVSSLDAYEALDTTSDADVQARFGFTQALVSKLQANGANGFNLVDGEADPMTIANSFQSTIGGTAYPETAFLK